MSEPTVSLERQAGLHPGRFPESVRGAFARQPGWAIACVESSGRAGQRYKRRLLPPWRSDEFRVVRYSYFDAWEHPDWGRASARVRKGPDMRLHYGVLQACPDRRAELDDSFRTAYPKAPKFGLGTATCGTREELRTTNPSSAHAAIACCTGSVSATRP